MLVATSENSGALAPKSGAISCPVGSYKITLKLTTWKEHLKISNMVKFKSDFF